MPVSPFAREWVELGRDSDAPNQLYPKIAQALAEAERAAAAEAVRPWELLAEHAYRGADEIVVDGSAPECTVTVGLNTGHGSTHSEALANLCEQLGLGKKESGR
jgi:hypothetical protein